MAPGSTSSNFWILLPPCVLLSALSVSEMGIVSSIVSYIHLQGPKTYTVSSPQYNFELDRIPAHLHLNPGHLSNGAAGTGFFLGLAGCYVAWRHRREALAATNPVLLSDKANSIPTSRSTTPATSTATTQTAKRTSLFTLIFMIFSLLETGLALSALVFVFVATNQTKHNTISLALASQEVGQHYSYDNWGPGTWFGQLLTLPLSPDSVKTSIRYHVHVMQASQWILVPLFIFAFNVSVAAVLVKLRGVR